MKRRPTREQRADIGCVGGGVVARVPGKRLYRIARRLPDDGGMRSFEEAQALAKTMPWWGRVAYAGADARWFTWQEV